MPSQLEDPETPLRRGGTARGSSTVGAASEVLDVEAAGVVAGGGGASAAAAASDAGAEMISAPIRTKAHPLR